MSAAKITLGKKRIASVLDRHGIATMRTLEMKISDSGPFNQRLDPHILGQARKKMINEEQLIRVEHPGAPWFHLPDTDPKTLTSRLTEQELVRKLTVKGNLPHRIGQALEIAIFRALRDQDQLTFFGLFKGIDEFPDTGLYAKVEPPSQIDGNAIEGDYCVDFIVQNGSRIWAAIEAKNIREWIYPDSVEVKGLIAKSLALDAVPVLIARRIGYVTFSVLHRCGLTIHQNYNQLYPLSAEDVAEQAKQKLLLGYHDIRCTNVPDKRMVAFIGDKLPGLINDARPRFEEYKDLLHEWVNNGMPWDEFSARVRRRSQGVNEDHDWPDEDPSDDPYDIPF